MSQTEVIVLLSICLALVSGFGGWWGFKYFIIRKLLLSDWWKPKVVVGLRSFWFPLRIEFQAPDESNTRTWWVAYRRMRYLEKIKTFNLPDTTPKDQSRALEAGTWQDA